MVSVNALRVLLDREPAGAATDKGAEQQVAAHLPVDADDADPGGGTRTEQLVGRFLSAGAAEAFGPHHVWRGVGRGRRLADELPIVRCIARGDRSTQRATVRVGEAARVSRATFGGHLSGATARVAARPSSDGGTTKRDVCCDQVTVSKRR